MSANRSRQKWKEVGRSRKKCEEMKILDFIFQLRVTEYLDPGAVRLNQEVVVPAPYAREAAIAPIFAPRVPEEFSDT